MATEYTDAARDLVHIMKYKYSGEAADLIADTLLNTLPAIKPGTMIVHVPTVTGHVRQRGFDHSARIAKRLAGRLELRHVGLLARITNTRQVGSSRKTRLLQMVDAFRLKLPYLIKDADILLVDDVLTTGATIEAAAKLLKHAGAKNISAVVFAKAK